MLSWERSQVYQLDSIIEVVQYKHTEQLQDGVVQEYHDRCDDIYSDLLELQVINAAFEVYYGGVKIVADLLPQILP